jgi:hypothetical protein
MKTTIIIPYRDRLEHLSILVPHLRVYHPDAEVMVVEQGDTAKFRKACLLNVGAKEATGDLLIFHDVDYVPVGNCTYYNPEYDVYLPVKFAKFVYNNLMPKPLTEVPGGYRHFMNGVDANFFGGVLSFRKDAFFKINGSCPLYKGWGFEDADLYKRTVIGGLSMERDDSNTFFVLDHPDSGPPDVDEDYQRNIRMCNEFQLYWNHGVQTQHYRITDEAPPVEGVDRWMKVYDFDGPTYTVFSRF